MVDEWYFLPYNAGMTRIPVKSSTYVALLRGVNAGKARRVDMKKLKALMEKVGCTNVVTYINSGNVVFSSPEEVSVIRQKVEKALEKEFTCAIPTLVKTAKEIRAIADAIPVEWKNDTAHRADIAYLFEDVDSKKIIADLPVRTEYMDIRYVKGAVFWHIDRKNYTKSHLNKLISHPLYQRMTVRNVNTACKLAEMVTTKT